MPAQTIIKLRRDTAANWDTANSVLAAGEQGYETDTGLMKIGDGTTAWGALPYQAVSRLVQPVKNTTGSTIAKGSVVYISGATGSEALVSLADADAEATSSKTIGLTAESIANDGFGEVVCEGLLSGVNTSAATAGQSVWLSSTAGGFVFGAPPAKPAHGVYLGVVVRAHANEGEILIKVQNGYELEELHDVVISSATPGQVLTWNGTTWINDDAAAGSGDVVGPASATDNGIVRYDGTTGKLIQSSGVLIDDSDNLRLTGNITQDTQAVSLASGVATLDLSASNHFTGVQVGAIPTVLWSSSADFGASTTGTYTFPTSPALAAGDLVVAIIGSDGSNPNLPSGWTSLASSTVNTCNVRVIYKYMTSTPDASVAIAGISTASTISGIAIRGAVNGSTPALQSVTGTSGMPNPPSITTTVNNSVVIAIGGIDDDSVTSVTAPAGYNNLTSQAASTVGFTTMIATKLVATAGVEDPAVFGGGGTDDWAAFSVAIAPDTSNAATSIAFSNAPARSMTFIVEVDYLSGTLSYPASVEWRAGTAPTLSGENLLIFSTKNGTVFKGSSVTGY